MGQKLGTISKHNLERDGQQGSSGKLVNKQKQKTELGGKQREQLFRDELAELGLEAIKKIIGVPNMLKTGD